MSHPAWVCGLKLVIKWCMGLRAESHPAWVCGLKQTIDTLRELTESHTLRGCVD